MNLFTRSVTTSAVAYTAPFGTDRVNNDLVATEGGFVVRRKTTTGCEHPHVSRADRCRPCFVELEKSRRTTERRDERFWSKVDKASPCWLWTGARSGGYGHFWDGSEQVGAHVFSYRLHHGPISTGIHVLHACDNPPCVTPAHLFLGTNQDNILDRCRKERSIVGEAVASAKLTDAAVKEIRRRYTGAVGQQRALAREYGVSAATMCNVLKGRTWRHVE